MNEEDYKQILSLSWYHSIDLGDGVVTDGHLSEHIWSPIESMIRTLDLTGKRVLDIGCWDGKWTFLAEELGGNIIATDMVDQRWGGRDTFILASRLLNSKAKYIPNVDVNKLSDYFEPESFDIVLFLGVLYHLKYPLFALSQVRKILKPGGIMICESHSVVDEKYSVIYFNYLNKAEEDPSNWSIPTTKGLTNMIESTYFEIINKTITPLGGNNDFMHRIIRRLLFPNRYPKYLNSRMVVAAKAVEREDSGHIYPDSFLSQYDLRS